MGRETHTHPLQPKITDAPKWRLQMNTFLRLIKWDGTLTSIP